MDLASAPQLTSATDVANLTSLGQGLVVLHSQQVRGVLPALGRLDYYGLARSSPDGGVVPSTPVTVLSAQDDCTAVTQLVPLTGGGSFLIGLWDLNGQRLVRVAPK